MPEQRFKIIPTAYLILMRDNKVLLSLRYNTGFHDGEYSLPAGHLNGNETLFQTIIRESKEEIGIELNSKDLRLVHIMHRKEPNEERINFFFRAEKWIGEPKIMEPHKCDDLTWFDVDDLPKNIIPYIRQAIDCLRNNQFYSEFGW